MEHKSEETKQKIEERNKQQKGSSFAYATSSTLKNVIHKGG